MPNTESLYFPQPEEGSHIDKPIFLRRKRLINQSIEDGTIDFLNPDVRDMLMMYVEDLPRKSILMIKPSRRKKLDNRGIALLLAMHEAGLSGIPKRERALLSAAPRKLVAHIV